eukprot:12862648-Ditylum_brightwellii.AAC.1
MNHVLIPGFNINIVTNRSQLGYSVKTLSNEDTKERRPIYLSDHDYDAIMEQQTRKSSIEYVVSSSAEDTEMYC